MSTRSPQRLRPRHTLHSARWARRTRRRLGLVEVLAGLALVATTGCLADFSYDFGPGPPDAGDAGVHTDARPGTDAHSDNDALPPTDGTVPPDGAPPDGGLPGCGNGILDNGEACDDGNQEDGDGCSADCRSDETCGNGIRDSVKGEQCDGSDLGGATCVSQGINAPLGTLTCTTACTLNTSGCCPVWASETVDDVDTNGSMTSSRVSVALDSLGVPHFAYRHDDAQELRYAWPGTSAMNVEVVDTTGNTGWHPALAMDSQNHPHILYGNDAGQPVLAVSDGSAWSFDVVDSDSASGPYGIALDSQDRAHVVYRASGVARYAYEGAGGWQTHDLQDDAFRPSIAVDSADRPHIAYLCWPSVDVDLRYAHDPGTGWTDVVVEPVGTSVMTMPQGDTAIAVDSADHPHIAYQQITDDDLKYAWYDGSQWHVEVVDGPGNVGMDVAIAVDSDDWPHIAYRDDSPETLRYVQYTSTGWLFQTPVQTSGTRLLPDLALDSNDLAHVFYVNLGTTEADHAYLQACP